MMKDVMDAFNVSDNSKVIPIKQGLINQTYRCTDENNDLLLQQVNTNVFKNPLALQENYNTIYEHLQQKKNVFQIPKLIKRINNELLYRHDDGNYWRAFSYIANSFTFEKITNEQSAFEAAQCYARFSAQLADLSFTLIQYTIPHFHDLSFRFRQFEEALAGAELSVKKGVANEIEKIFHHRYIPEFYHFITSQPQRFRKYIMHHDCKISNILFDATNNKIVCPVDLDTTMPGYFFSDLGDMIRSMGNNLPEDSTRLEEMQLNSEIIQAIFEGYSNEISPHFTPDENTWLPFSGHILTYMQALRFLTDHLNKNIYYQVNYPLHNADRTKNQLQFLQLLLQWKPWPE